MNKNAKRNLRAIIVDDEELARSIVRELLRPHSEIQVVAECVNGFEAVKAVAEYKPDLLFLDVQMPKLTGFDVLELIGREAAVIFVTAYDEFAMKAFEVHAVDYLLKPIRLARLKEALARATRPKPDALREIARAPRTHLSAQERGKIHLIPVTDVIYLKAELKYVSVRTAAREYLIEESLTRLELEFAERFVRVHRNCLVARSAVRGFERSEEGGEAHWEVLLHGITERIAVSRRQQHVVRELSNT